jgi:hypothetical protein
MANIPPQNALFLLLKEAAAAAGRAKYQGDVREMAAKDSDVIHVAKGGLPGVGHPQVREAGLQPHQEGLQVEDKEKGGQGVPLPDGRV